MLELQDARIFGENAISEPTVPNVFSDQLDIHPGYLEIRSPKSVRVPVSVRIGRQKLAYGSQRLVSPLEWVNTARVFDGMQVRLGAHNAGAGALHHAEDQASAPMSAARSMSP